MGIANPFILDYILTPNIMSGWAEYYALEPFVADRIESALSLISYMMNKFMGGDAKIDEFFISKREVKRDLESEIKKCFMI